MQLVATPRAQFFTQHEYYQVKLESNAVVLISRYCEERIPFSVWNGEITVKRGLLWGSLTFFAHREKASQQAWCVQGLPWGKVKSFARQALESYQNWYNHQCHALMQGLPEWESELQSLLAQDQFLTHSSLEGWAQRVRRDLAEIPMSIEEAKQRMPVRFGALTPWLLEADQQLKQRNQHWVDNSLDAWSSLFDQIESAPLNLSQRKAVLLNDDYNLILAGAGCGKTSVLIAKVGHLLAGALASGDQILMLAFGREAAQEMSDRLKKKLGAAANAITVATFHQLGLKILAQDGQNDCQVCPLSSDEEQRRAWCSKWLKEYWSSNAAGLRRWQKHLQSWPIAYLKGDDELASQYENPKLIQWLDQQMMHLAACGWSKKQWQAELEAHDDQERLLGELNLVWPCYQSWQSLLKDQQWLDFPSMISKATAVVNKKNFTSPWRYILVDEYQDISPDRLALVESLCFANEQRRASLYAVGDDWQSIYQFTGAQVTLTTDFAKRFPMSSCAELDTTYRYPSQLGQVANQFIAQNPEQLPKEVHSARKTKQKAVVCANSGKLATILDKLNQSATTPKSVLLLGRNHYHKPDALADWQGYYTNLSLSFMTCHASKGKEADFVILLNVDEGQFPAKVKQHHLNQALAASAESYPFAEERRLFYVALTRAKEKVWVTYQGQGSAFVRELIEGDYPIAQMR